VDAIFSSSSSNMDRRHNAVLDTLFDKGGELLRDECKSKYNWQIGMDDIAEIRVGNLPCKTVYMASIKGDTDYVSTFQGYHKVCYLRQGLILISFRNICRHELNIDILVEVEEPDI
jgi:hypothetical protein